MDPPAIPNKSFLQPKPILELLPELSALMCEDAVLTLTAKKKPRARPTIMQSHTTGKVYRPLTLAEMGADLLALKPKSPKRHALTSTKKKGWNSSVKVQESKKILRTADGQLKNNPVRKVLNFQTKPKLGPPPSRVTIHTTETPKFTRPEPKTKKPLLHLQARNTVRISGISNIPQTPIEITKTNKNKVPVSNKENHPHGSLLKKVLLPQTPKERNIPVLKIDTPSLNSSWRSGSDASFLQKEKEIDEVEKKVQAIVEEDILEDIAEISPPVSTPFKEYRNVQEFFNNSSCVENSLVCSEDTIMCFDKPSFHPDNDKREESVIVSLCDLFNKATVTNNQKINTELENLLEVEKQTVRNIEMLKNGLVMLNNIKDAQIRSLQNVRKLISEKRNAETTTDNDKTLIGEAEDLEAIKDKTLSPEKNPTPSRPCSVIKSLRSPSYKIPKKNQCLRKKIVCKSMPNVSTIESPIKRFEGKPRNVYMKMKEQMNFLSTPMVNREVTFIPDTPAVTSKNLQKQLDKLYGS